MKRFSPLWLTPVALIVAVAVARCGGEPPTGNPPGPAAIAAVSGNDQRAPAGSELQDSLVVVVTDSADDPASGIEVTWAIEGGGTVSAERVSTGADGRAGVRRTLGPTAGPQGTSATVGGLSGSPVTFTATATSIAGPGLTLTTPPPSSAQSGEIFTPQPVLSLNDASGGPLAGMPVTVSLIGGGTGLQGSTQVTTDAAGRASFTDLAITGAGPRTLSFSAVSATAVTSQITITDVPAEVATGKWSGIVPWPDEIVPLHSHLMPTGTVLAWGRAGQPYVWDPIGNGFTRVPVDTMLFCAGHAFLSDGRLLVSGGHLADDRGLPDTHIFSASGLGGTWTGKDELPDMYRGRWYPTVTELPDGRMVTVAGRDSSTGVVDLPELWNGSGWTRLTGASLQLPYYPRDFLAPDGRIFYAGERVQSRWLNVDAPGIGGQPGQWTTGPSHRWPFERDYGSAVMYRSGKILYVGGGGDPGATGPKDATSPIPTRSAEVIDINNPGAPWAYTDSMAFPRRHLNATVLPDGQVLVTGGLSGGGFNNIATGVHEAELWNPDSGQWNTLAANAVNRGYHAVSLLLPDGTVMHGASGDANIPGGGGAAYPRETNHEIFSPPYLFKGARPTISAAPAQVAPLQQFSVGTPFPSSIARVTLIKLASVTHAFDAGQRFLELNFSAGTSGLTVTGPENHQVAPPGYYMLFLLNRNGVPSTAAIVQLQ